MKQAAGNESDSESEDGVRLELCDELKDSSLSAVAHAYVFAKSKSRMLWAVWILVLLAALAGFGYTTYYSYDHIATCISIETCSC